MLCPDNLDLHVDKCHRGCLCRLGKPGDNRHLGRLLPTAQALLHSMSDVYPHGDERTATNSKANLDCDNRAVRQMSRGSDRAHTPLQWRDGRRARPGSPEEGRCRVRRGGPAGRNLHFQRHR